MSDLTILGQGRPAELLMVEDNYGDVLLARKAFLSAKIANNLSIAGDGEQALGMLRRVGVHADHVRPDLILLDLNLPRMDGKEVLKEIKADPDLQRIPVIVLTSSSSDIDVLKSYELNANGYIVKPVNLERLKEIVASLESFWFAVVVLPSTQSRPDAS